MDQITMQLYAGVFVLLFLLFPGVLFYLALRHSKFMTALVALIVFGSAYMVSDTIHDLLMWLAVRAEKLPATLEHIPGFDPRSENSWQGLTMATSVVVGSTVGWGLFLTSQAFKDASHIRGSILYSANQMTRMLSRKGPHHRIPVKLGNFEIPQRLETRSVAMVGPPGSGKTQLVKGLLKPWRDRGDRIAFFDPAGELCSSSWRKADLILSPVIKGSQKWSPFSEIRSVSDATWMATCSFPTATGESESWREYARVMYAHDLVRLLKEGRTTNRDLVHTVQIETIEELKEKARGTPVQRQFEKGSERMLSGVLSIMSSHLSCLSLLDPSANESSTSLRRWIAGQYGRRGVWFPYYELDSAATQPLRTIWANILIKSALSLKEDERRRILVGLDELVANGVLDVLPDAVARGRKYGLTLVLAAQNLPQIVHLYGEARAKSILASVGHLVALRVPDPDTAKFLSETIGDVEVWEDDISVSSGGGSTERRSRVLRRVVLPSEISALPDLHGYVRIGDVGWSHLKVPVLTQPDVRKLEHKTAFQFRAQEIPVSPSNTPSNSLDEV